MAPPAFTLTSGDTAAPVQRYSEKKAQEARCNIGTAPVDKKWETFATGFNETFKSVLHVFTETAMHCGLKEPSDKANAQPFIDRNRKYEPIPGTKKKKLVIIDPSPDAEKYTTVPEDYKGSTEANAAESPLIDAAKGKNYATKFEQSAPSLSAQACATFFTEDQRTKLTDFMKTGNIPDRLFNGEDAGNLTAQQRILLSAVILSTGKYVEGSITQKMHAQACWHWVHLTNDYAGTSVGSFNMGMMGSTDHNGNAVWNTGTATTYYDGLQLPSNKLPTTETQGYGPIRKESGQGKSMTNEEKKALESGDPSNYGRTIARKQGMTWEQIREIEPGDWLYVYNANGSNIGCHSVIFSHWASDTITEDGVTYRKAVLFSQGKPENGGAQHLTNIGTQYFHRPEIKKDDEKQIKGQTELQVTQVTWATRFSPDSRPATTEEDIAPAKEKDKDLEKNNEAYLTKYEKKAGHKLDRDAMMEALRADARKDYDVIKDHLSVKQQGAVKNIIEKGELIQLIRVLTRLDALRNNIELMEGLDAIHQAKKEGEHATWEKDKAPLEDTYSTLSQELAVLEFDLKQLELKKSPKDLPGLKKKLAELNKTIKGLKKSDPKIASLKIQVDALKSKIALVESDPATKKKYEADVKVINGSIASKTKEINLKKAEANKAKKKLDEHLKVKPFVSIHPGDWQNSQDNGLPTGSLEKVMPESRLEKFLPKAYFDEKAQKAAEAAEAAAKKGKKKKKK